MKFESLLLSLFLTLVTVNPRMFAQERSIDTAGSKLTVRAFKSGLF